ncbi:MAG TPA: hypothetical protein VFA26_24755 [Gemmataceae bacterium]|nr:hypothetical protein [Gemmataceae bacterium]
MQPDPFDVAALRLPAVDLDALRKRPPRGLPRHRQGEKFLKGPVPWAWLERAGRLPGRALLVGLLLWREAGCRKGRTVTFCLTHAREWGCDHQTFRRGLRALAGAGLVTVHRRPGRALSVTLLDAPAANGRTADLDADRPCS